MIEIAPPQRLVFEVLAVIVNGERKFTAHTTVVFEAEGVGTRMTVRQAYEIFDAAFRSAAEAG